VGVGGVVGGGWVLVGLCVVVGVVGRDACVVGVGGWVVWGEGFYRSKHLERPGDREAEKIRGSSLSRRRRCRMTQKLRKEGVSSV